MSITLIHGWCFANGAGTPGPGASFQTNFKQHELIHGSDYPLSASLRTTVLVNSVFVQGSALVTASCSKRLGIYMVF